MRVAVGLTAITLLGLALRLLGLDAYGVTFDEAYHVALVRLPDVGGMLDAVLSNPPSDPLYVLLLRPLVEALGHHDALIRAPSVLAGTLTIPAAAWLGVEVTRNRSVALLTAVFVAISPYALEFSQEAAPYAVAALATTATLAAAWRWRRTGATSDAALLIVLGVVAVYSHYAAVAILALVAVLGATRWGGSRQPTTTRWLAVFGLMLLAWAPWALAELAHWAASPAPRASLPNPTTVTDVVVALTQFGAGTSAAQQAIRPLQAAALIVGALLLALGWRAGADPDRRGLRVLLLTAAVLFLVPAVVSALTGAWLFIAHFTLLTLPALLVVAAAGALMLTASRRGPGIVLTAAWLAISAGGLALTYADPPHGRDGLQAVAARLEAQAGPDDAILVAPSILQPPLAQYLDRATRGLPNAFDLRDLYGPFAHPPSDQALATATDQAAGAHARVWLVYRPELDPAGVILATLERRYTLGAEEPSPFATLYRFDAKTR